MSAAASATSAAAPAVTAAAVKRLKAAAKTARKKARRAERALAEQQAEPQGEGRAYVGVTPVDVAAARRRAEAATAAAEAAAAALAREALRAPQTFPPCPDVAAGGASGGVDLVQGLVLHREAVTEHEEQELAERRRKQLEQEAAQHDTVRACGCPRTPALPDLSPP